MLGSYWRRMAVAAQAISFIAGRERRARTISVQSGGFTGSASRSAALQISLRSEIGGGNPEYLAVGIFGIEP